ASDKYIEILFNNQQVSAVPLVEEQDATSLKELFKKMDLDLDLNFDLDLGLKLDQVMELELPEEGDVAVDEFAILDRVVRLLLSEAKALGREIILLTERQLLKIFLYPLRELEKLAEELEQKALDAGDCALNVTTSGADILTWGTVGYTKCAYDAASTSINLVLDTKKAVLQLTVDAYQIYTKRRECKAKTHAISKKTCITGLYLQYVSFVAKAPGSILHLIGLRKSVPAVATDATACTNEATENVIRSFNELNEAIDACAANFK
ncbi:hypothetical protein KR084_012727, partial [Drosophila pseudotakahashii]